MDFFLTLVVSGLLIGVIYGLVAVGFVLIYKASGIFNFAQGEMLLVGGYIVWTLIVPFGLPVPLAIILGFGVAFGLGWLVQRLALQRLIGESILALVMATIALSQVFHGGVITIWGSFPRVHADIMPSAPVKMGIFTLSTEHLYATVIAGLLLLAFVAFFRYSRWGLAMRGVAEGHQIVRSMGISVRTIMALAWAIAMMIATVGGILLGSIIGFTPDLGNIGLVAIPAAFIGGLTSIPGTIVGGLLIGVVESLVGGYVGMGAGTPAAFMLLVIVMFFRPYGLWGLIRIERV